MSRKNLSFCEQSYYSMSLDNPVSINADIENYHEIINIALKSSNVIVRGDNIELAHELNWNSNYNLTFYANNNILLRFEAKIKSTGGGHFFAKSGMDSKGTGKVIFEKYEPQLILLNGSKAFIYYNPQPESSLHKYFNPQAYFLNADPMDALVAYMQVNNLEDLNSIRYYLHGNYALSRDIDASATHTWNKGEGFIPISGNSKASSLIPYSGQFDGNGYEIYSLYINRPTTEDIGLFGTVTGQKNAYASVSNLKITNATIIGDHYVGSISGNSDYAIFNNIYVSHNKITARDVAGGIVGSGHNTKFNNIGIFMNISDIVVDQYKGFIMGSGKDININNINLNGESMNVNCNCCIGFEDN